MIGIIKRGVLCRLTYLAISVVWYLVKLGGRFKKNGVILCYHGICPEQKQRFEKQMTQINRQRPDVRVTFDDAFANLLDTAVPLLNKLHIPSTIFAVPSNLGQSPQWIISADDPDYKEKIMTARQLKSVQSELIKIGSHTQTHPDLSKLSPEQIRWELTESKKNLELLLDQPIEDLALPHGAFNQDVLCIAEEAGYKRIYTTEPKLVKAGQETGVMGRFSMSPEAWQIEFILTCAGAYAWLFQFRRLLRWKFCRAGKQL